ncbi:protein SABRE isoform X3 [Physcomitrium patens]|uniref:FMP27/BLTP2/Hobbit GFWDK motif-containing RBG unit domain-containing protein n=1 Tax=Physcomitrium patens TaxID=3218 RepID=A0A2K1JQK9_PHYPA|nr:protein SABRE-like isoform X1 [Physcomitrium patens]PNR43823.1 hypothetical protein PHYPA_016206 [Physcomitrium patens]|eukprot:XP_024390151.1 protein SABRE-like isoform X1 [Physcomitrella patens]
MEVTPDKFVWLFLAVTTVGWLVFNFTAKLLAWIASRVLSARVSFRLAGFQRLKDVSIQFRKGAIASVTIGEVRISFRKQLSALLRDFKFQLFISDVEVILQKSVGTTKKRSKKPRSIRNPVSERRKWIVTAKLAKYLKLSLTELVFKVAEIPKLSLEIKDLELDLFKQDLASTVLGAKLSIKPFMMYFGERHSRYENSGPMIGFRQRIFSVARPPPAQLIDAIPSVLFLLDHLTVSSSFDHDGEAGVMLQQLDVMCGDVSIDLSEDILLGEAGLLNSLNASKKSRESSELHGVSVPESSTLELAQPTPSLETDATAAAVVAAVASGSEHISPTLEAGAAAVSAVATAESPKGRIFKVPEKIGFCLPKLSLKCSYKEGVLENVVTGIQMRGKRVQPTEPSGDLVSQLDVGVECGEIMVLRENNQSFLEILKVVVGGSLEFPAEASKPVHADVQVQLGGTQCSLMTASLDCWLKFIMRVLRKPNSGAGSDHPIPKPVTVKKQKRKLTWGCTFSAPELTLVAYSLDGMPLYNVNAQTSHLDLNSGSGYGLVVNGEMRECVFGMAEETDCSSKDSVSGGESCNGCLMRVSRVVVEWVFIDSESVEDKPANKIRTLILEAHGSKIYLSITRVRSILSTWMVMERYLKSLTSGKKPKSSSSSSSKAKKPGLRKVILRLESFLIQLTGSLHTVDAELLDPKKVNYGIQGGETIISKMEDGSDRKAWIRVARGSRLRSKYKAGLELTRLSLCFDKEPKGVKVKVERGNLLYQELDSRDKILAETTAFGVQIMEVLYQPAAVGSEKGNCVLVSVSDIAARWEPDVHLFFHEVGLQFKRLLDWRKSFRNNLSSVQEDFVPGKTSSVESTSKRSKGKVEVAIDIEGLVFTCEIGDGAELMVQIQSIFSEDAQIGVLAEQTKLFLNNALLLSSERLQVSRIPYVPELANKSACNDDTVRNSAGILNYWDCIIQASGTRIVMPFRLPLRGIEDAYEDQLRALKLAMAAQKHRIGAGMPAHVDTKPKKVKSSQLRAVQLVMRDVVAEIEEEPIQGWFDEHHRLLREQVCELIVREQLFDAKVSEERGKIGQRHSQSEGEEHEKNNSALHKLVETGLSDPEFVKKEKDRLYIQTFEAYRKACEKLVVEKKTGEANVGLQAGFRMSSTRRSLVSLSVSTLEVILTNVEGGREGMIQIAHRLDCVEPVAQIPFSRVMGRKLGVNLTNLVVRIRDYTLPLLSADRGQCEGVVVLAQQATVFPPQMLQDVYLGRWRRVSVNRSISGSTPAMKFYSELPIELENAKVCYGVGHEPAIADVSWAFSVALRRTDISVYRHEWYEQIPLPPPPVKKERSLPWWDDMRYYIHGINSINATNFELTVPATTDPYEENNHMRLVSKTMEIKQSEGCIVFNGKDFGLLVTTLEALTQGFQGDSSILDQEQPVFLSTPVFQLEITMDWDCESGTPLNHYLHALPNEMKLRDLVYDPFRSTSLSLWLNFVFKSDSEESNEEVNNLGGEHKSSKPQPKNFIWRLLRGSGSPSVHDKLDNSADLVPTVNLAAHDLSWIFKWWNLVYLPPHKLRSFARFYRFNTPRIPRSGNLSLDKVITEFMLRVDSSPTCIKHYSLMKDDPAKGLTFLMQKLKYEMCYSRGRGQFTINSVRDPLELVYQGLDINVMIAELHQRSSPAPADDSVGVEELQKSDKVKQLLGLPEGNVNEASPNPATSSDLGFLLSTDCFTIRKQAPKADSARLSFWQEAARRHLRVKAMRHTSVEHGSGSDLPSDDDGFSVVLADNCLRVSLYGLKLLWTIANRDAVWAWVGELGHAFESPKLSPSRQYAQRRRMEEQQKIEKAECERVDAQKGSTSVPSSPSRSFLSHPTAALKGESPTASASALEKLPEDVEEDGEGTMHFMVNVVQPQFNLDSEEANGRLLLAAASGRVLARSIASIVLLGGEALVHMGSGRVSTQSGGSPIIAWKRRELSVILEHVQAHIAPTDVDPGAGIQWLPRITTGAPKIKRTGTLLEQVFMPCTMYFQYTRQKGGTTDSKVVKPLKDLSFNSPNITATMTSRQFQIMVAVISNLLLARLPKPRKNRLYQEGGEEEEADEVVPDGIEEVELARIRLEQAQRDFRLLFRDLRTIGLNDLSGDFRSFTSSTSDDEGLWMLSCPRSALALRLQAELIVRKDKLRGERKALRKALQGAAQQQLMVKEKNKTPSAAMRISWVFEKLVWSMLCDGDIFAEAEINSMTLNVDRDFKDVGVAKFTVKSFVVKNNLPSAKLNTVLAAWNPPKEWGRNSMLRVDAKQSAPKDGRSPLECFEVSIYPLRIYLTETMYRKLWDYLFPGDEQDVKRQTSQEVWKVSTAVQQKRGRTRGSTPLELRSSWDSGINSSRSGLSGPTLSLAPPAGLPPDTQHAGDFSVPANALEKSRKVNAAVSIDQGQCVSLDRLEETEVETMSEEVIIKTSKHGSSVRTTVSTTSRQDVLTAGGTSSNIPTTSDNSGSVRNRDRKISKTDRKSVVVEERKEIKKKTSMMEFHNIKISQVELLVTYEGSRFAVSDLRLLMDTFLLLELTGSWRRLFSKVKKHIIWSVLKSVTGMQGKKFKDKLPAQPGPIDEDFDVGSDDSSGSHEGTEMFSLRPRRNSDRAGEGFVSSIRGLFNSQRKKAKALVLRTRRGPEDLDFEQRSSASDEDRNSVRSPRASLTSITKAKKLLRLQARKHHKVNRLPRGHLADNTTHSAEATPSQSEADVTDTPSAYEDLD